MALVLFHTRAVRDALKKPEGLVVDLIVLLAVIALIGALLMFGRQFTAPYHATTFIDLSFRSLPKYTFFSLCRGMAAYVLSLAFTLVYGTIAAHNARAEKLMLPALDVLQAIPVLGFLPGLVLAMIALFPTREIGLELACVVMIFTGQAWNMTFSFHGSLRGVPQAMREVAAVNRLTAWQTFRLLEVPAAMIGLVWNSMMSMAGGWFFLTVNEAFTLGNRDYRLPGIGSYMNEAINKGNVPAMIAAIFAMGVMIVAVDQLFWRPIVVWSQKYKIEELTEVDKPQSWVLDLLQRSRLFAWVVRHLQGHGPKIAAKTSHLAAADGHPGSNRVSAFTVVAGVLKWVALAGLSAGVAWGAWSLVRLLVALPIVGAADSSALSYASRVLGRIPSRCASRSSASGDVRYVSSLTTAGSSASFTLMLIE